ncbi:zygote arrest protein 1 isoform X2 [Ahaetulla prasina]|uniref:zygote arrest protein 1 isoform X2 n=1 Tax=Ahaetulla prasina TaxID=499056 RepID=UPI0026476C53|nr:zygote arrest protein 1 isoform X2 [Ahaetulla prasina]
MATLMDEAMESYAYPAYNPYSYRYQPPKSKGGQGAWRHHHYHQQQQQQQQRSTSSGYFSGYSEAVAAAAAAEYFDNYQRAQLKAILSQVNPNLTPRLRKANTKEVGVQVNPRQDASVQCSLGPRPLFFRARARGGGGGGGGGGVEQEQGCPVSGGAARHVRFPRTIAVYSPVASRRLTTFVPEAEPSTPLAARPPGLEGEIGAAAAAAWRKAEESDAEAREGKKSASVPDGAGGSPSKPQAGSAAVKEKEKEEVEEEEKEEKEEKWKGEGGKAATPQLAREEGGPNKARMRFQFLEQKYGYYHCKDCNIRWESAYVWCVQGTNKVYFRQFCRTCQKSYNPYRVENITCQPKSQRCPKTSPWSCGRHDSTPEAHGTLLPSHQRWSLFFLLAFLCAFETARLAEAGTSNGSLLHYTAALGIQTAELMTFRSTSSTS